MARPQRKSTQITKIFADNISTLVAEKKETSRLDQNEIAREMGVSEGALSGWCSDSKTISIDSLPKVAAYFGVSVDWLLGMSEIRSPDANLQAAAEYTGLTEKAIEMITHITAPNCLFKQAFEELLCDSSATIYGFLDAVDQYADSKVLEVFLDEVYEKLWRDESGGVGPDATPIDKFEEVEDRVMDRWEDEIAAILVDDEVPPKLRKQLLYDQRIHEIGKESDELFGQGFACDPLYQAKDAIKGAALAFASNMIVCIAENRVKRYKQRSLKSKEAAHGKYYENRGR